MKHINCDNCGKAVAYGKQVWKYGSMRYCNGRCLVAAFQENELEPEALREKEVMKEATEKERRIAMMREVHAKRRKKAVVE